MTHWKNGTETMTTLQDNMTSSFTMMVIGANLTEGYQIRPEVNWTDIFGFPYVWPPRYLNESKIIDTPTGPREVNVLNWTHPPIFDSYTRQVYYWDKATGIQMYYESEGSASYPGTYSYLAKFELIDSSTGVILIPEFTELIQLMTTMLIAASIAVLWKRKR